MQKTAGHILKGEEVKLEGQFHLDLAQTGTTAARPNQNRIVHSSRNIIIEISFIVAPYISQPHIIKSFLTQRMLHG